jgi:hypothetical protein
MEKGGYHMKKVERYFYPAIFTYENGYISVKLDKIECHQMVVFE